MEELLKKIINKGYTLELSLGEYNKNTINIVMHDNNIEPTAHVSILVNEEEPLIKVLYETMIKLNRYIEGE